MNLLKVIFIMSALVLMSFILGSGCLEPGLVIKPEESVSMTAESIMATPVLLGDGQGNVYTEDRKPVENVKVADNGDVFVVTNGTKEKVTDKIYNDDTGEI